MKVVIKSLFLWLMIIPLAVFNGEVRGCVMQPLLGRYALPLGDITLCGLVLALAWLCIPRLGVSGPVQMVSMGSVWAGLAVVFEGALGLAMGRALAEVLAAYDMTSGNLWLLVVFCVGCAPWAAAKMRRLVWLTALRGAAAVANVCKWSENWHLKMAMGSLCRQKSLSMTGAERRSWQGLQLSINFLLRLRQINMRANIQFSAAVDSPLCKVYSLIHTNLLPCLCMAWGRTAAGPSVAISLFDEADSTCKCNTLKVE